MTVFSACCFICSLRQDSLFKNRHRARDSASHDGSLPFAHLSIHGSPSNTFRTTLTGMLPISLSRGRNGSIKPLKRWVYVWPWRSRLWDLYLVVLTLLWSQGNLPSLTQEVIPCLYFLSFLFKVSNPPNREEMLTDGVTWVFVDTEYTLEVMR